MSHRVGGGGGAGLGGWVPRGDAYSYLVVPKPTGGKNGPPGRVDVSLWTPPPSFCRSLIRPGRACVGAFFDLRAAGLPSPPKPSAGSRPQKDPPTPGFPQKVGGWPPLDHFCLPPPPVGAPPCGRCRTRWSAWSCVPGGGWSWCTSTS